MERRDLLWLGALAAGLLALFVWPTLSRSYPVGVGSDFTVYLWWARVAAARGLSVIGGRPGSPALIDAAAGTLHLPLVTTVAGLQYAVAASAGPAAAALVRGRVGGGRTVSWLLAGALAGVFATHLGSGYLATLGFVICFLAACAALAAGTSRGAVAAALLLGGGGLLHPLFFLVGGVVLGLTAGWAWAERRWSESLGQIEVRRSPLLSSEEGRIVAAIAGGAAVIAAGLLSMLAGPARIAVDTSKDAFLRRIGLGPELRHEYRDRFHGIGIRIDILTEIAASVVGAFRVEGTARRILASWLAVTVVGIPGRRHHRLVPGGSRADVRLRPADPCRCRNRPDRRAHAGTYRGRMGTRGLARGPCRHRRARDAPPAADVADDEVVRLAAGARRRHHDRAPGRVHAGQERRSCW